MTNRPDGDHLVDEDASLAGQQGRAGQDGQYGPDLLTAAGMLGPGQVAMGDTSRAEREPLPASSRL
ncbi:hypothetical protein [Streptomyces atratus]